jgi:hypothetical protein
MLNVLKQRAHAPRDWSDFFIRIIVSDDVHAPTDPAGLLLPTLQAVFE